ncbi:MAG TPA: hypothetical protein VJL07_02720 [Dehalococcoidia bacterium]|nr:hypothetical protein [Dehalococcoidia bacterium]
MRVTDVLHRAGLINTEHFSDYHRDRGTGVHQACHFWDEGDLEDSSLVPEVRVRLDQYKRFLVEVGPEIIAAEREVVHSVLGYRGRLDRIVRINGRTGVLDIKGVSEAPWHGVQLFAYMAAYNSNLNTAAPATARWNLYLYDDHYKLVERTDRQDFGVFCAALTLARWKEKHGS